jgi:RNA polymerase sigma-70 factor, ECF subfamily
MIHTFDNTQPGAGPTCEALMARVKNSDGAALAELHRRHSVLLRGVIARIIHNDGDIDDLMQEVFLQVWNSANNYSEEKGQALGWLITIARRRTIDRLRKKQSYFRAEERLRLEPVNETCQHTSEEVNSNELRGIFKKLMAQLPAAQRDALHLAYYCDLSQREIATRTGTPLGTIKTRLELAMRKIRAAVFALEDFRGWVPAQSARESLAA